MPGEALELDPRGQRGLGYERRIQRLCPRTEKMSTMGTRGDRYCVSPPYRLGGLLRADVVRGWRGRRVRLGSQPSLLARRIHSLPLSLVARCRGFARAGAVLGCRGSMYGVGGRGENRQQRLLRSRRYQRFMYATPEGRRGNCVGLGGRKTGRKREGIWKGKAVPICRPGEDVLR